MKRCLVLALLCGALLAPMAASADPGFSSANVNLRAGPGTRYPSLDVVPVGTALEIIGCLTGYSWCDVSWGHRRGWVSGAFLRAHAHGRRVPLRQGPPPVITFDFGNYWAAHYKHKPFYEKRARWQPKPHAASHQSAPKPAGGGHPQAKPQVNSPAPGAQNGPGHKSDGKKDCRPGTPGCRS